MNSYIKIISCFLISGAIAGCNNEEFDPTTANTVILEAYLYAGEPVDSVKLSQLIPFLVEDENETYEIEDAEIFITWREQQYKLVPTDGYPGYYHYSGIDLEILEGEQYDIELEYFDESITATTTVPTAPTDLEISVAEIEIPPILSREDLFAIREIEDVQLLWDNTSGDYYYVLVHNIEDNPDPVDVNGILANRPVGNFQLITEPTTLDFYNVRGITLNQYGTYEAKVYKVNQEYADLYETSEQDSRSLNEPLSNINNGLGVFTSFSSQVVSFEVVQP